MLLFAVIAALFTLFALALLLWPLLATPKAVSSDRHAANVAVLRDERAAIDRDVAAGTLGAAARDEALAELARRAESDLSHADGQSVDRGRHVVAAIVVAAVVPIAALLLYLTLGTPRALDLAARAPLPSSPASAKSGAEMDDAQILAMVESLKAKMKERPDDPRGWQLLARSMVALDRFPEAVEAYRNLVRLQPTDPDALADLADALGVTKGGDLEGEPTALVIRGLAENPSHQKSLALAASAAMNRGDKTNAIALWQRLAATLAPESEDRKQVDAMIADLRAKPTAAAALPVAPPLSQVTPLARPGSVVGTVGIAPALAQRAAVTDAVFIVARAFGPDAPRAPVAVFRTTVAALAGGFVLDDSMAMAGTKLSATAQIEVEARVAKGGGAARQSGDLFGKVGPVAPGVSVKLTIDQIVP